MRLSLIIPAFNERERIATTIAHACEYLSAQPYEWELLVVIDGDGDGAVTEGRSAARGCANVRVLVNHVNRGKGYSVRRGIADAEGVADAVDRAVRAVASSAIDSVSMLKSCSSLVKDVLAVRWRHRG